jgi:hypothetical protein
MYQRRRTNSQPTPRFDQEPTCLIRPGHPALEPFTCEPTRTIGAFREALAPVSARDASPTQITVRKCS